MLDTIIRRKVGNILGENVYFMRNVDYTLRNIGVNNSNGSYDPSTIRSHLKRLGISPIKPKDFGIVGINSKQYGILKTVWHT